MTAKKQAALLASCKSLPNSPSHSGGSTPVSGVFPGQVRLHWTLCSALIPFMCIISYWFVFNWTCYLSFLLIYHFIHPILLGLFTFFRPATVVRAVITPHHSPPLLWSAIKRLAGRREGINRKVQRPGQSVALPGDALPVLRYIFVKWLILGAQSNHAWLPICFSTFFFFTYFSLIELMSSGTTPWVAV